jgi:hypothetical protein
VQIGQDQVTVKVAFALTGSGRSTRPCSVHLAVGKPFKPKLCSSSIMKHPPRHQERPDVRRESSLSHCGALRPRMVRGTPILGRTTFN